MPRNVCYIELLVQYTLKDIRNFPPFIVDGTLQKFDFDRSYFRREQS